MKVLVTGATGGLGRNAVDYLLAKGHEVRATGRNTDIGTKLEAQGAEFVPFDLTAAEPRTLVRDVDAIWHCAALSSPWGSFQQFWASNVGATALLARAAGREGVGRFVHVSTPSVYFDYRHHRNIPESYRPHEMVNHYARTKSMAEQALVDGVRSGDYPAMTRVILRPRGIFGRYDQALVPRIERVLLERGGKLPLPNGGSALVDLTYAENVVHAMWLATVTDGLENGDIFNVTNDAPTTVADVLTQLFVTELGQPFAIKNVPYRAMDIASRILEGVGALTGKEPMLTRYSAGALAFDMTLDISAAKTKLGYRPVISMSEGIARTADWMKHRG